MNRLFTSTIALASSVICAHSAVVLQDTYATPAPLGVPTNFGGGVFGYDINLNPVTEFSAAGHGKMIVVLSGKDEAGGDLAGAPVTAITYDGVSLNQAIFHQDGNRVSVGIFYLDNVASDGTLRFEFSDGNQSEFGFGLYAVDGLLPGVQDTASAAGSGVPTAAEVTLLDEGFVVQEAARNNQSLTANGGDDWTTLYDFSGPQSYQALSQYQIASGPGNFLAPINNTGQFKRVSQAAFQAVPEPSSLALVGLGGLLALSRRRRA